MPDLAVIVPSRGRPENIRKVIAAWDFTDAWGTADLVVVADADDPEIGAYRKVVRAADLGELQLVEVPSWVPMVHKLNAAARDLAPKYFALGFAGDDHLPQTIGWAKRYLTVLHELGCGMVYSDDGYQGVKLATEWAITSDVVRALGRMVPADVEHMYCDNSIMELFAGAGALRHLPEVRIEHFNPYAGHKAAMDEQYKRVNGHDQYTKDRHGYTHWQRYQKPADIASVRALRVNLPEVEPPRAKQSRVKTASAARPVIRNTRGKTVRSAPTSIRLRKERAVQPPRHFKNIRAATPENVMITLADFASQVCADHEIVELGVFQGRTALQMAWGAGRGNSAHVTGVDAWALAGNTYGPPFAEDDSRRWAEHWVQTLGYAQGITLINDFSHNVAASWTGKPVGLLFVDADHSKQGARDDIVSWAPHLVPCARIAVDDYGHYDWPGVAQAVDELVADGFLEPIQVFHDQLAVTTLTEAAVASRVTAITSEGVSPPPDAVPARLYAGRGHVQEGELAGIAGGTAIDALNLVHLKSLAKVRGITLGARKDKRDLILAALADGA